MSPLNQNAHVFIYLFIYPFIYPSFYLLMEYSIAVIILKDSFIHHTGGGWGVWRAKLVKIK